MVRFWRKNRRPPPPGSKCWGVDLNRNYDLGYGLGASTDPCQEVRPPHAGGCCSCVQVYQGPGPLSEPETAAMTGLGAGLNSSLLYYVSLHAYGQSWLTPWGFKTEPVASMDKLVEAARASFKEVRPCGRVYYSPMYPRASVFRLSVSTGGCRPASTRWAARRTSTTWRAAPATTGCSPGESADCPRTRTRVLCRRRTGAQVAYTIELPDDGREFGFLQPAARAPRVGEEIWTALTTLALHTLASTDTRDG